MTLSFRQMSCHLWPFLGRTSGPLFLPWMTVLWELLAFCLGKSLINWLDRVSVMEKSCVPCSPVRMKRTGEGGKELAVWVVCQRRTAFEVWEARDRTIDQNHGQRTHSWLEQRCWPGKCGGRVHQTKGQLENQYVGWCDWQEAWKFWSEKTL